MSDFTIYDANGRPYPANGIPSSRLISTTSPLTGGGDLTADRTLALGTVGLANGGTGQTSNTKGDLLAANGSAWNKLAVGTDGQVLTADAASTNGVKWAAAAGGTTLSFASVTNSANVAASGSSTWTRMTWDTELDDPDGYHSTSSNTGRMTVPSGKAGRHLLLATMVLKSISDGQRDMHARFYKNGSFLGSSPVARADCGTTSGGNSFVSTLSLACEANLADGDYIEVWFMMNDSGGSGQGCLSSSDTADRSQFTIIKIS